MKALFRINNYPLYLKILLGMVLGIFFGYLLIQFSWGKECIHNWIRPWGTIFIKLLQMIAVPLVFFSLLKGITGIGDIAKFSRLGLQTLSMYIATTLISIILGVTIAQLFKPGKLVKKEKIILVQEDYSEIISKKVTQAKEKQAEGPLLFLEELVPNNIFKASSNNSNMLQIIFFTIIVGIAILLLPKEQTAPFIKWCDSLEAIILKIVTIIINFAPFGVFALMVNLIGEYAGNLSIFVALAAYAGSVVFALLLLIFFFYPILLKLFTKTSIKKFVRKMYPVQLLAFSTSSSSATLPVTLKTAQKELNISEEVSDFVLPIGTTINMDGTSCYQAIAVIFIAQVLGISLGLGEILSIVLLTTLSSIGTPAIPGGSYIILTMVLTTVGIPAEGLALILGVDRPLDMLRTSVNVTGDITVASIIDKKRKATSIKKN